MRSINKYMIITNKCNHTSLVITKARYYKSKISPKQGITKQDITKTRYHQSKISLNQGITKSRYSQNQNN